MRIGELAASTQVSVRSLRYYEQQGLLEASRSGGGQREYSPSAVERVRLVQQLFRAGLTSRTIVQLLPCVDAGRSTPESFAILVAERDRITSQLADLQEARDRLDAVIESTKNPTPEMCPTLHQDYDQATSSGRSESVPVMVPR